MTVRVMATLEVEGRHLVVRDEAGGELARVTLPESTPYNAIDVATDVIADVVHDVRSRDAELNGNE